MVVLAQLVRASNCELEGNGVVARTLPKGEITKGDLDLIANQCVHTCMGVGNSFLRKKIVL